MIAAGRYFDALNNKHKPTIVYERMKSRQLDGVRLEHRATEEIEMPTHGHTPNQYSV
ncbi:hypothetical protein HWV62_23422 [Athelia sp. TMB]|nr:hypothetical protein HWV62_23422 [Athelia sp. TMB]